VRRRDSRLQDSRLTDGAGRPLPPWRFRVLNSVRSRYQCHCAAQRIGELRNVSSGFEHTTFRFTLLLLLIFVGSKVRPGRRAYNLDSRREPVSLGNVRSLTSHNPTGLHASSGNSIALPLLNLLTVYNQHCHVDVVFSTDGFSGSKCCPSLSLSLSWKQPSSSCSEALQLEHALFLACSTLSLDEFQEQMQFVQELLPEC
jgi:hypothetical protein